MKVGKIVKYAVAKLLGKKDEALKAVAEFLLAGSAKATLFLHFNIFSTSVKVHILNCVIAKKPIPPAGAQKFLTAFGHVVFSFYSVNNTVKLPDQVFIVLSRQLVISPAIEINTYLCVAPRQVYEALKAEVKDGFDEFEALIERLKKEVKPQ
jgi:hypothetical protein